MTPLFTRAALPLVVMLCGAAAPGYLPVNHQRVVPLPSQEVWRRVHDFLQDQGVSVVREDRAGGVIDARRSTPGRSALSGLAECSPKLFFKTDRAVLELTVLVRPVDDGTRVTVNAAFLELGRPGRRGTPGHACTSNGVLEAAVLDIASGQPMESAVVPH